MIYLYTIYHIFLFLQWLTFLLLFRLICLSPFPRCSLLFTIHGFPTIWGKTSPCLRTFLLLKNLPESLLGIAITHMEDPSKIFKPILKKCPSQSRMSFGCGNGTTCTFEQWNWASLRVDVQVILLMEEIQWWRLQLQWTLSGWYSSFNPCWKILVKLDHLPR